MRTHLSASSLEESLGLPDTWRSGCAVGIPGFVAWYTHMVWKYYERHKPQQLKNAGWRALRMDASLPLEDLTAAAIEHVRQSMRQRHRERQRQRETERL